MTTILERPAHSPESALPVATGLGRHAGTRSVTGRSVLSAALSLATTGLLAAAAIAFVFFAVGPHLFGYRTATMLTGSMAPGIMPGDVIVSVERPAADLAVGDVITFAIPVDDHRIETHRVIEVTHPADGSVAFRTQGDANNGADPWTATVEGATTWHVASVIPHAGLVIRAIRTPAVLHALLWGAPALLVLMLMVEIWRRPAPEQAPTRRSIRAARR